MNTRIVYIVLTVLQLWIVDVVTLECYECGDSASPTSCNTSRICTDNQVCFLQSKSTSSGNTFDMGCRGNRECGTQSGVNIIGRSVTARRQTGTCLECCSTDMCNSQLCHHDKPSTCVDDDSYDCANIESLFHICQNTHQAQKVCPKFCDLCNVVDGNWSTWSTWSSCDVTCGNGTQTRTRTCTSPAPAYGGLNCSGTALENKQCVKELCPVHGGWSLWTSWGTCSVSCGVGLQRRNRSCSSPYPARNGDHCFGDARDDRVCIERPCADGGWSDWGRWEPCTAVCEGGITRRYRQCDNPRPSTFGHACIGNAEQTNICNTVQCISDCYEIKQHNKAATSGVYTIRPRGVNETVLVYCDMDTDGGGWTVFQRRINGTVDFYRTFNEYEIGFGNINGEFWLGLKYIQQMTAVAPSELRLDLTAADDSTAYEVFRNFSLSAGPAYTLHINKGTGTAGDSYYGLSSHNGYDFHTKDHDNQGGCAVSAHGGWWYWSCAYVNLNGDYATPGTRSHYIGGEGGVTYYQFKNSWNSLKRTQMMFRKL